MRLTDKQIQLMTVITKGNGPGKPLDLDEILDRVDYDTSKESLQFSIRALVRRGLIIKRGLQKRRGRQRVVIEATALGFESIGMAARPLTPHYVTPLVDEELERALEDLDLEGLEDL